MFMDLSKLRESLLSNACGRFILGAAAFLYGCAVKLNLYFYEKGLKKAKRVNTRVVCIGNITAGGTGKTTAVLLAADALAKEGLRVAVASRGYKRSRKKNEVVVLFDQNLQDWRETGDEPYMMSQLLAQYKVPVAVSSDRYAAATQALKQFKSQIILLDDGFQHHKLYRDADIVLIDAKNPFGGGALLPLGMLREPVSALKRAAIAVITHSNLVNERAVEDIKDQIRVINDEIEILESVHRPDYFFDLTARERISFDKFRAAATGGAACFCGIGDPGSFEETLENLGLKLKKAWRFPDHGIYTLDDIRNFEALRGGLPLVTTFKDAVKLPAGWQEVIKGGLYILAVSMEIRGDGMGKFVDILYPKKR
jgi:tetraacyldisaccharide 4'-kinase